MESSSEPELEVRRSLESFDTSTLTNDLGQPLRYNRPALGCRRSEDCSLSKRREAQFEEYCD